MGCFWRTAKRRSVRDSKDKSGLLNVWWWWWWREKTIPCEQHSKTYSCIWLLCAHRNVQLLPLCIKLLSAVVVNDNIALIYESTVSLCCVILMEKCLCWLRLVAKAAMVTTVAGGRQQYWWQWFSSGERTVTTIPPHTNGSDFINSMVKFG